MYLKVCLYLTGVSLQMNQVCIVKHMYFTLSNKCQCETHVGCTINLL